MSLSQILRLLVIQTLWVLQGDIKSPGSRKFWVFIIQQLKGQLSILTVCVINFK